jgi:hypothetical protein
MMEMKKILAFGIILLFIGVAIAPSINISVVKASNDNDLVEVTTQACGIKGYGNTTVKLTREQYQNLGQYLVEFRARLNQTSTREDAVPIFKEAVVELDKYGLLPKGMSVEQGQKLVIGRYQKSVLYRVLEKTLVKNQMIDLNTSNFLCLIYCNTDGIISVGPFLHSINRIYCWMTEYSLIFMILYTLLYGHEFLFNIAYSIWASIYVPLEILFYSGFAITSLIPVKVFNTLTLGGYVFNPNTGFYEHKPTNGWVDTFGLNGIKIFQNQPLWGHLFLFPIYYNYYYFPGILGFTGIQITSEERMIHLGSALWVDIGSDPPDW